MGEMPEMGTVYCSTVDRGGDKVLRERCRKRGQYAAAWSTGEEIGCCGRSDGVNDRKWAAGDL